MLTNIIDKRERKHRWKCVHAIIEPTCNDNVVADADHAGPTTDRDLVCEDRRGISVSEAVTWAIAETAELTLYLYDMDGMPEEEEAVE